MKKIFFVFAVITTFALVSCGNSTTSNKQPISDSIVKPVAKSTTDSLLNMANQTAKGDSLNPKTATDSTKAQKK